MNKVHDVNMFIYRTLQYQRCLVIYNKIKGNELFIPSLLSVITFYGRYIFR